MAKNKSAPVLDLDQPYGTICGGTSQGVKYTQFGLNFDKEGKCLTTAPTDLTAAETLIDAAHNPPAPVEVVAAPALDVQAVRFAHSGAGKYDVFGSDGSKLADNITKEEAEKMVPTQVGDENLLFKQRSDLIARVNKLGGKVERKDTSVTLIKKIKELQNK